MQAESTIMQNKKLWDQLRRSDKKRREREKKRLIFILITKANQSLNALAKKTIDAFVF